MDLSSEQTELLKKGLLEVMREIHSGRLETALRVTYGQSLDATPVGEFTSGGEVSDPTGNRAVNRQRRDPNHQILLSLLETVETSTRDLVVKVREHQPIQGNEARRFYAKENAQALTLAPCASIACPDQAPEGRRHCDPCADYLEKRPGVTQVPKEAILNRLRVRKHAEKNRLHVTGPLVEEFPA